MIYVKFSDNNSWHLPHSYVSLTTIPTPSAHLIITSISYVSYPFSGRQSDTDLPYWTCQEVNDTALLLTHKAVRLWSLPSKLLFSIVCSKSSCATCGRLSPGQVRPCVNGLTLSFTFHLDISGFSQRSALEVLSSHLLCYVANTLLHGCSKRTCISFWFHVVRMKVSCHYA